MILLGGLGVLVAGAAALINKATADEYNEEAEDINDRAESMLANAKRAMNNSRTSASRALKRLDDKRQSVMENPLKRFGTAFAKIKNFSYKELAKMPSIPGIQIGKQEFFEMEKLTKGQVVGSFLIGGWLCTSFAAKSKARENLENARSNMAMAKSRAAKMRLAAVAYSAVGDRAHLFVGLIACACEMFYPQLEKMEKVVRKCADYKQMSPADQNAVCFAVTTVQLIRNLLSAPIISDNGHVDTRSTKIAKDAVMQLTLIG